MEPQITRKSVPLNPLKSEENLDRLEKQGSIGAETPDKVPTNYDGSSFNTSLLNDMNNMSMVSFNLESVQQLGLGELGQSMIIDDVNLMQIKETLHARELKIKQLIGDKQKLKGLLVKAKSAISKVND